MNDELIAAYGRVRDKIDPPIEDLKLRGKTYPHLGTGTLVAADRLLDLMRSDDVMRVLGTHVITSTVQRKDPAALDETVLTRKERDQAFWGGLEQIIATALQAVRGGREGVDELAFQVRQAMAAQGKIGAELASDPDFKAMEASAEFVTGSIKDLLGEVKKLDGGPPTTATTVPGYI